MSKSSLHEGTEANLLSGTEKVLFNVVAGTLTIGFFLIAGLLYFLLLNPVLGEEKAAAIFVFVVVLPLFLIGHLLANVVIKKSLLPRYLSRRGRK